MKHHILYHANCADGFAAACIAYLALKDQEADLHFHAVNYDEPVPSAVHVEKVTTALFNKTGLRDRMTILDFCYPRPVLDDLAKHFDLLVLDHHSTAEPHLIGVGGEDDRSIIRLCGHDHPFTALFNPGQSGSDLAWDYFNDCLGTSPKPIALQLLSFYDLGGPWTQPEHAMSEIAQNLQAGLMRSMPRQMDQWLPVLMDDYEGEHIKACVDRGAAIRRAAKEIINAACRNPLWLDIAGYRVPAVTGLASEHTNDASQLLQELYPNTAAFVCLFHIQPSGRIRYSLRCRKGGVNVAEIAARMDPPAGDHKGGGGHPCAAGFSSPNPLPLVV